ncbi:MAG: PAC2 family protein, partial [Candidatus Thermoplasmatota archaeon]|nr:PAC2 family protein [Candidatus Thermoplasmatota archaeon]
QIEDVYGVPSSVSVATELSKSGVKIMSNGIITGVSSVLLNLSARMGVDVMALLAEVQPEYPNARAAAKIIEAIDKILKYTEIDVSPLYVEAEKIETAIRAMQKQAMAMKKGTEQAPIYA